MSAKSQYRVVSWVQVSEDLEPAEGYQAALQELYQGLQIFPHNVWQIQVRSPGSDNWMPVTPLHTEDGGAR